MTIWIVCLPIAFILFTTGLFIIHKRSPFSESEIISGKTRTRIYASVAIPVLIFTLLFTHLLNTLPIALFILLVLAGSLISIIGTEGTYILSKQQKWNKILVGISGIVGTLLMVIALVSTIVSLLPPGTVN